MTSNDFFAYRDTYLSRQMPARLFRREEISFIGDDFYKIGDARIQVNPYVSSQLDSFIGLTREQASIVRKASGEAGIRDFRNYLAAANSITKPVKLALIGDPESRKIVSAVPIKDQMITAETFFDFAEMFMDKNGYEPKEFERSGTFGNGLTIYMDSHNPIVRQIAPDEDFMTDSLYIRWNQGEVEVGSYFVRLVCINGQIQKITSPAAKTYSLEPAKINRILNVPSQVNLLESSFDKFRSKALAAIGTRASMAELKYVSRILDAHGVDEQTAEVISPYRSDLQAYADSGKDISHGRANEIMSSRNVWDVYNDLTRFATHNDVWEKEDNRRGSLKAAAVNFLGRERDIRKYVDIF